jgi:hypothetical protein
MSRRKFPRRAAQPSTLPPESGKQCSCGFLLALGWLVPPIRCLLASLPPPIMDTSLLTHLKPQEIPFDHPQSYNTFDRDHFVATPAAIELHGTYLPICYHNLRALAREKNGIDYLQVFEIPGKDPLWFMDDGFQVVTALLPSDY